MAKRKESLECIDPNERSPSDWATLRKAIDDDDAAAIESARIKLMLTQKHVELAKLVILDQLPHWTAVAEAGENAMQDIERLSATLRATRGVRPQDLGDAEEIGTKLVQLEKDLRDAEVRHSNAGTARQYLGGLRVATPELFGLHDPDQVRRLGNCAVMIPPDVTNWMNENMLGVDNWLDFGRTPERKRRYRLANAETVRKLPA